MKTYKHRAGADYYLQNNKFYYTFTIWNVKENKHIYYLYTKKIWKIKLLIKVLYFLGVKIYKETR